MGAAARIGVGVAAIAVGLKGCSMGLEYAAEHHMISDRIPPASGLPEPLSLESQGLICPAGTDPTANPCTTENALGVIAAGTYIPVTLENTGNGAYLRNEPGVPSLVEEAIIANEDREFLEHNGVDDRQLLAAARDNAEDMGLGRGASTLTMQYVDLRYPNPLEGRVPAKILEMRRALRLEIDMKEQHGDRAKDVIMEGYVNWVQGGRGTRGVEAMSQAYFGVSAKDATIDQAAFIGAVLTNPSDMDVNFFPHQVARVEQMGVELASFRQAHPELEATEARDEQKEQFLQALSETDRGLYEQYHSEISTHTSNYLQSLHSMAEEGYITEEEATQNAAHVDGIVGNDSRPDSEGIQLLPFVDPYQGNMNRADQLGARHFTEGVRSEAANLLQENGTIQERSELTQGYRIYTTLNTDIQAAAFAAVQEAGHGAGDPEIALTRVDADGGVVASVGGRDYNQSHVDLATSGRPAGSTMKPFMVASALENGFALDSVLPAPGEISLPVWSQEEPWNVRGEAFGDATLEQATAHSLNTYFAQLAQDQTRVQRSMEIAQTLGVRSNVEPSEATPSTVLGSNNVTTRGLAEAYNGLMRDGRTHPSYTITLITDAAGTPVYTRPAAESQQVISPEHAQQVAQAAKGTVTEGTAAGSFDQDDTNPHGYAAKTGTTQESTDTRFVEFDCAGATSVWEGFPEGLVPMPGHYGAGTPAEVTNRFLAALALDPNCHVGL